ncbi:MAG: TolC family protein [Bacteroidales bacterium]|nr:TolC family protein [Bacteroidales bacterium]
MKQQIITLISSIVFISNLYSQDNIKNVLSEIEKNNTTLSALRKSVEAKKTGNKTGIYLQNPEVGFNFLWGDPSVIGNRTDISIIQTFDFPTAYSYRNQIADIKNEQLELEYQKQLRVLLLQARLLCFDLVYQNALKSELSKRLGHAQSIADSYRSKFDIGETNILEYNKAQLNLLNIRKGIETIEIERVALLSELSGLNGGIIINFSDSEFKAPEIPADFEQWYSIAEQNNPVLNWLRQEIEVRLKQEKYMRALSLPKLQAGYMSEKIVGEQFQGVTLGLTIPLWENKNSVKYAKANTLVFESIAIDNRIQFYNQLKALFTKATGLLKSANDYRINLQAFDNTTLLEKALDKGEITMINYILELSIYYESVNNLLELERDMNKALAELEQYM